MGNGDIVAIDLSVEANGRVVYLSHEGDESHGFTMAHSPLDCSHRGPDDALFDSLVAQYRADPDLELGRRAIRVASTAHAEQVIEFLYEDQQRYLGGEAARRLAGWDWQNSVPGLKELALTGCTTGRISAIHALASMTGPAAATAIAELRTELDPEWHFHLRT